MNHRESNLSEPSKEAIKQVLKANHYIEANKLCDYLLQERPNDVAVLRLKARALQGEGKLEEASQIWERLSQLLPSNLETHLNRARLAKRQHQWRVALEAVNTILDVEPFHLEALKIGVFVFERDTEAQEGEKIWRGLSQTDFELLEALQARLENDKRWFAAASALKAMLGVKKNAPEWIQHKEWLLLELVDQGKLMESWEDYKGAALLYRAARHLGEANSTAERLLHKMMRPLVKAAQERWKVQDFEAAKGYYTEILIYDPDEPSALNALARIHELENNFQEAYSLRQRLMNIGTPTEELWLRFAFTASRTDHFSEALKAYQKVHSPSLEANVQAGLEKLFRHTLKTARTYLGLQQYEAASSTLRVAEEINPEDLRVNGLRRKISQSLSILQLYAYKAQEFSKAASLSEHLLLGNGGDIYTWKLYARALSASHQHSKAQAAWEKVIALDPEEAEGRLGLARTSFALGEKEKSLRIARALLEQHPEDPKIQAFFRKMEQLILPPLMSTSA